MKARVLLLGLIARLHLLPPIPRLRPHTRDMLARFTHVIDRTYNSQLLPHGEVGTQVSSFFDSLLLGLQSLSSVSSLLVLRCDGLDMLVLHFPDLDSVEDRIKTL